MRQTMTTAEDIFWDGYKQNIIKHLKIKPDFENSFKDYSKTIGEASKALDKLKANLKNIPLGIALHHWLTSSAHLRSKNEQHKHAKQILELIEKRIIPITNKNDIVTLNLLQQSGKKFHHDVIDDIRRRQNYSIDEQEQLIESYLNFSKYLHQSTLDLIPLASDPDREQVKNKAIPYDTFIKFIQFLAERDALIAKLLYFGAPTIEETLLLRCSQVNFRHCLIQFEKHPTTYPKHIIQSLKQHINQKKPEDLIFTNFKGSEIERTHLNHSFGRASNKMSATKKITPRDLLKHAQ